VKIIRAYMTENPSYKRNRSIKPIGVLVHSTGAVNKNLKRYVDAPDRLGKNQYNNHWNKSDATKSVHAFIGYDKDKEVIVAETIPPDRACWGCGGGKNGSYNYDPHAYLQFEICQGSSTDEEYYWEAIRVAENYCAYLCAQYGWTAESITSHKEACAAGYASNHGDPQSWMKHFGDDMNKFRARVAALLNGTETPVEPPVEKDEQEPVPESGEATEGQNGGKTVMIELNVLRKGSQGKQVKTLQHLLTAVGCECGNADGIFGSRTLIAVKTFQKARGLTVDGVVGKDTWTALLK
jgi:N-acetylmuramoyl-L-alanine amidase